MSSIDRRVVEMEFDNKQFERGVRDTLKTLEELKEGLKLDGAVKGLEEVNAAATNTNLSTMANAVNHISDRFSALGAIGFSIIQKLTQEAMGFAARIGGLVLDPLISGGRRRAQNIEQAKFMFRGLSMDIEQAMADALYAVKGTAFGLDEAARAASQLGASQVELGDDMKVALRGISGVAAMTNSSYEDTAHVFTRVAGQGRVMANDLNSLASRGLNAAATLAEAFGVTEAEVREMVSEGEIGFADFAKAMDDAFGENATKANETYTGSLSNLRAALSRIGASFFGPFLEDQRDLFNTITPAIDAMAEALEPVISQLNAFGRGSTKGLIEFINAIDFTQAYKIVQPMLAIVKNLYQALKAFLGPIKDAFVQIFPPASVDQISELLKAVQRFTASIKIGAESADRLRRVFAGVFAIFSIAWTVIKRTATFLGELFGLFSDGSFGIFDAAANLGDFLVALDQAVKNGEGLTTFFDGLLNALERPLELLRQVTNAIFELFDFKAPSSGSFDANFAPLVAIGEFLLRLWNGLFNFLGVVGDRMFDIAQRLGPLISGFANFMRDIFDGAEFEEIVDTIQTVLMGGIFMFVRRWAINFSNTLGSVSHNLTEPFRRMTFALTTMQNTLRVMTLMQIAVTVALLTASVVALSKVDAGGLAKALTAVTLMFTQLGIMLKGMSLIGGVQGLVGMGGGLVLLAVAIRILTSSVKALAEMEWEGLFKGLTGVTVLLVGLGTAVRIMGTQTGAMFSAGAGILIIAFAIKVLVDAVKDFSDMNWGDITKGLVGVAGLLAALALFTRFSNVNAAALTQGAGILLLAGGIWILSDALVSISKVPGGDIAKAMVVLALIFANIGNFMKAAGNPALMLGAGAAMVLFAGAVWIFADAIQHMAQLSWEEMAKGLITMSTAVGMVALAVALMPPTAAASGAAIVLIAGAMVVLAEALRQIGDLSWEELAKGLISISTSLGIFALTAALMTAAIPGAVAIMFMAAAMVPLAYGLGLLGQMSWGEIGRGLVAMAGAFLVLGAAGALLAIVTPAILALGIAVGVLGLGLGLAGAGVLMFASALTMLAAAGAAGTVALVAMFAGLIGLIPMLARALADGLVIFVEVVAEAGPRMVEAMSAILEAVLTTIAEQSPNIIETFGNLILDLLEKGREVVPEMAAAALEMMIGILTAMRENAPAIVREISGLMVAILTELADNVPDMARAGTDLLVALLESVAEHLDEVITAGADIVIALIEGIGDNALRMAEAAMDVVIEFVDGLAAAIETRTDEIHDAGRRLAFAMVNGMTGGLASKVGTLASKAREMASSALGAAGRFLGVSSPSKEFMKIGAWSGEGMAIGLQRSTAMVSSKAEGMGETALGVLTETMSKLSDVVDVDPNLSPTITPILDLSTFQKDAGKIAASLPDGAIKVDVAYSKAKAASSKYAANEAARNATESMEGLTPSEITYNQYNNSPKALSEAEIYRQTRNQLSTVKGALDVADSA